MDKLPKNFQRFMADFPDVIQAYDAYGQAIAEAGPLDDKTRSLIKLAISIGARMDGAAKSHVRKALAAGATPNELRHVALLSAPTIGFPNMMAGLVSVNEVLDSQ